MYWNEIIWYGIPLCIIIFVWLFQKRFEDYLKFSLIFSVINALYAYMLYFHDSIDSLIHVGGFYVIDWIMVVYTIVTVCGMIYVFTAGTLVMLSYLVYRLRLLVVK